MAFPSLGAVSFISFSGRVNPLGQRLQQLDREGMDGQEYRTRGTRSTPTQHVTVVDIDTAANARILEATYAAMKGTAVTLTYPDQQTFMDGSDNVIVLDVEVIEIRVADMAVGGVTAGGPVMVTARWTLQGIE